MFVVCGESLMDVFSAGDTASGTSLNALVGGSPLNVATGLARLGQPVSFLGAVSRDFLGDRLLRALVQEGIATGTVVRTDAPTTLGLVGLDAQGVPCYTFYGTGGADRQLSREALRRVPSDTRALHFGSYSMVVEPVASTLRELVSMRRSRALIAYDPNIRLNVEPEVERWRDTLAWMRTQAHLLKVSEEDLGLLFPGTPLSTLAAEWLRGDLGVLVVTRGAQGAIGWTRKGMVEVPSPSTRVVDTVGAGDTAQAALLTWLAEHDCLAPGAAAALDPQALGEALSFATLAASITCSRKGADLPHRSDLPQSRAAAREPIP